MQHERRIVLAVALAALSSLGALVGAASVSAVPSEPPSSTDAVTTTAPTITTSTTTIASTTTTPTVTTTTLAPEDLLTVTITRECRGGVPYFLMSVTAKARLGDVLIQIDDFTRGGSTPEIFEFTSMSPGETREYAMRFVSGGGGGGGATVLEIDNSGHGEEFGTLICEGATTSTSPGGTAGGAVAEGGGGLPATR